MNESKISVRYAKALFGLAKDNNLLNQVKSEVVVIYEVFSMPQFNEFLSSPVIAVSKKQEVFNSVFKSKVTDFVLDFLVLLVKNRRESFLKIICLNFLKLYRKEFNIVEAELTTAVIIDEVTKSNIILMLNRVLGYNVEVIQNVKEEIIGGYILRIEDKQIDESVKTKLQTIKKQLLK